MQNLNYEDQVSDAKKQNQLSIRNSNVTNSWLDHHSTNIAKVGPQRMEAKGKEISQKVMDNMQIRSKETQTRVMGIKGE